ncbi:hypothetical protein J5Y09_23865 [Roseomonas sp. PWR1]|uniref:Uncharacterized protein n=1 Tax=Roseomonas nitratireducens TaxID=2820810 RepID=A0ABS4B063_9PROT|nr:hypothetical protein [Neoroseomonas nitratireducens]MBP0466986.1 hypothetical protein [Neoroseomonas nitratireducens]
MAETLTIHLVNKAGDLRGRFEASHLATTAALLKGWFETVILSVPAFSAVAVRTDTKQGDVKARDLVCYLLTSAEDSIVAKRATEDITLGVSGSTMMGAADKAVVSEVYMRQIVQKGDPRANATTNREQLVAGCILHELIHNISDATTPVVTDVHKVKDGVICRELDGNPLTGTEAPNEVDNKVAATALTRRATGVKQHASAMPA